MMPNRSRPSHRFARHGLRACQRGVALLVALLLLVVITLVGLAAIGTTLIQNKAASNQFDRQLAFQAAETALRQAEAGLAALPATTVTTAKMIDCSTPAGGTVPASVCPVDAFSSDAATLLGKINDVVLPANQAAAAAGTPQFVVQYLGKFHVGVDAEVTAAGGNADTLANYYRISARSANPADATARGRAIVVLQSIFRY